MFCVIFSTNFFFAKMIFRILRSFPNYYQIIGYITFLVLILTKKLQYFRLSHVFGTRATPTLCNSCFILIPCIFN